MRPVRSIAALALVIPLLLTVVPSGPVAAILPTAPEATWQADGDVRRILAVGDRVFVGGKFDTISDHANNTISSPKLAVFDRITGDPLPWPNVLDGTVFDLAASPDGATLYVSGAFEKANGVNRKGVAAFDIATGALLSLKIPRPNYAVLAIGVSVDGSTLFLGGGFTKMGGVLRKRLAAVDSTTGALTSWAPEANGLVRRFLPESGRTIVTGAFTKINGLPATGLAAVDPVGALLPTGHATFPVLDIEADANTIYAVGSGPGGRVAAYDLATLDNEWIVATDGNMQGLALYGGFVYAGGHHTKIDGTDATQLSRLDKLTGAVDTSWIPLVNGLRGINDIAATDGRLHLGGDFTHVDGVAQEGYAILVDDDTQATADLVVTASASASQITVGDDLAITIGATNLGPQAAPLVEVELVLPIELTVVSLGSDCVEDAPGIVTCELGVVNSGSSADAVVTVQAADPGDVVSSISVSGTVVDPDATNNVTSFVTQVQAASGTADLSVEQSVSIDPVPASAPFDYVLTVTNNGPDAADSVVVTNELPAAVQWVASTPSTGTCSGTTTIVCDLGTMATGTTASVQLSVIAPASAQTIQNSVSVTTTTLDPDDTDDASTVLTSVGSGADSTPPGLVSALMQDLDADGRVDNVRVTFDEPLAICSTCVTGWVLDNVPSGGTLLDVVVNGAVVDVQIAEGPFNLDTSVGAFTIELDVANTMQDASGNNASFLPIAPADGAGPVPSTLRKFNAATNGIAEAGDKLTTEWSEELDPSSVAPSADVSLIDPGTGGNDVVSMQGFQDGDMDTGAGNYVSASGSQADFLGSLIEIKNVNDTLTLTLGQCTNDCASLTKGDKTTVIYRPPSGLTDLAGNLAVGEFVKTFRLF